jgi:hypothetical protein
MLKDAALKGASRKSPHMGSPESFGFEHMDSSPCG